MAVIFYLFFLSFGSVFILGLLKKRGLHVSWAWARPSVLLPRLASPVTQFGLVAVLYLLLRAGHTLPASALMACLLAVGVFGTVSLAVRASLALGCALVARVTAPARAPAAVEEPYTVVEHPDSARFRQKAQSLGASMEPTGAAVAALFSRKE